MRPAGGARSARDARFGSAAFVARRRGSQVATHVAQSDRTRQAVDSAGAAIKEELDDLELATREGKEQWRLTTLIHRAQLRPEPD